MNYLPNLADRALNAPLLVTPEKAEVLLSVLSGRIGIEPLIEVGEQDIPNIEANRFEAVPAMGPGGEYLGYSIVKRAALINVVGSLVNRGSWLGARSGLISYEGLAHQMRSAASNGNVDQIVMDFQTGGGEAAGAFDMADIVREVSMEKPVVSVVNDAMLSAGYLLGSQSSRIVTTQTGSGGSIGVLLVHMDKSEALKASGVKPTLIFKGDRKVDGNPFESLSDDVRSRIEAQVSKTYDAFVSAVAIGRPALNEKAIRDTQADVYVGKDLISAGLADEIGTLSSVLDNVADFAPRATGLVAGANLQQTTETEMTDQEMSDLREQVMKDEKERIGAIMGHSGAAALPSLANHLAFKTDMAAGDAGTILDAAALDADKIEASRESLETPAPSADAQDDPSEETMNAQARANAVKHLQSLDTEVGADDADTAQENAQTADAPGGVAVKSMAQLQREAHGL